MKRASNNEYFQTKTESGCVYVNRHGFDHSYRKTYLIFERGENVYS